MTEGRHYWGVEISGPNALVDAVRPGLDHDKEHRYGNDSYSIWGITGSLRGNGKNGADPQSMFAAGDRIGVLLDLDAGWMCFYLNGKRCGPGYTEGVTGPLVRRVSFQRQQGGCAAWCGGPGGRRRRSMMWRTTPMSSTVARNTRRGSSCSVLSSAESPTGFVHGLRPSCCVLLGPPTLGRL